MKLYLPSNYKKDNKGNIYKMIYIKMSFIQ